MTVYCWRHRLNRWRCRMFKENWKTMWNIWIVILKSFALLWQNIYLEWLFQSILCGDQNHLLKALISILEFNGPISWLQTGFDIPFLSRPKNISIRKFIHFEINGDQPLKDWVLFCNSFEIEIKHSCNGNK